MTSLDSGVTGLIVASMEVKTRVAAEQVDEAQQIAAKYQHKLITCEIGDDVWNECVEKEHSTQVILQLWVMKLQNAFYIMGLPGISTSFGKIVYIVMGHLTLAYANSFFDQYLECIEQFLLPLYKSATIDKALQVLPEHIEPGVETSSNGFSLTNVFKTSFQTLYNCL